MKSSQVKKIAPLLERRDKLRQDIADLYATPEAFRTIPGATHRTTVDDKGNWHTQPIPCKVFSPLVAEAIATNRRALLSIDLELARLGLTEVDE